MEDSKSLPAQIIDSQVLDELEGFSIHEISLGLGTEGLIVATEQELKDRFDDDERKFITDAMQLALEVHKGQVRTNGPYVDHILRVGLRIMRSFKVFDKDIIAAGFLHDAVEDQPERIVELLGETGDDPVELIAQYFDDETAFIVDKMSFVYDPSLPLSKNEQYAKYVEDIVYNHPKVRVVKLSDYKDNAAGNHYTNGTDKTLKLDQKYLPLHDIHLKGLHAPDSLIPEYLRSSIEEDINRAKERALNRLKNKI